jgi:hypothetical protein
MFCFLGSLLVIALTTPTVGILGALACALGGSVLLLPASVIMIKRAAVAEQSDT